MFGLPDSYTIRARIFPAVIAVAPAIALVVVVVSWKKLGLSHIIASVGLAALLYAFADVARRRGKRIETLLYQRIGGKPSTAMLRHRDATLPDDIKNRWLEFLASKIKRKQPTAAAEQAGPTDADAFYELCGHWLRENTRDLKKFKLIFEENVTYGFRRNLLGLKWPGLGLNAIVVLVCLAALWFRIPISVDDDVAVRLLGVLVVAVLHATFFLLAVNQQNVIEGANQYARQLLLACESLQTGAPLKKASRRDGASGRARP